jgi:hypothetical protein
MVEEAYPALHPSPDLYQSCCPLSPSTPLQDFRSAVQMVLIEPSPDAGSHTRGIIVAQCAVGLVGMHSH